MSSPRSNAAVVVGLLAALSLACAAADDDDDNATDETGETEAETSEGAPDGPTWDNGIAEIFAARCGGCHEWALDYELVSAETDYLWFRLENGHGDLSEEELAAVGLWIENGTPL